MLQKGRDYIESNESTRRLVETGVQLERRTVDRLKSAVTQGDGSRLARGLGLFSVGLGLAELAAPGAVAELIGVSADDREYRTLIRACGVRELASGIGLLRDGLNAGWLWSRTGGDVMDLALLGAAFVSPKAKRGRVATATAAVLGVTLLDLMGGQRVRRVGTSAPVRLQTSGVEVRRSLTINRPPEEVYGFWRQLDNLPTFMSHLESVHVLSERQSHWRARGPAGLSVEWDAEIIEDEPNRMIAWCSLEGADVDHVGRVRFVPAPGNRGTEVHVEMSYRPPVGAAGRAIAKLFGEDPDQQVSGDLRRLKQVMETGELVHSDASLHRGMHAGRPPAGDVRA